MKFKGNDEKGKAVIELLKELHKGRESGKKNGWLTLDKVEQHLGISKE